MRIASRVGAWSLGLLLLGCSDSTGGGGGLPPGRFTGAISGEASRRLDGEAYSEVFMQAGQDVIYMEDSTSAPYVGLLMQNFGSAFATGRWEVVGDWEFLDQPGVYVMVVVGPPPGKRYFSRAGSVIVTKVDGGGVAGRATFTADALAHDGGGSVTFEAEFNTRLRPLSTNRIAPSLVPSP